MNPNGSTRPVPSVSMATVDRRSLPSRGRSFQNDAREGRSPAGEVREVTGRSMAKVTDIAQMVFGAGRDVPAIPMAERTVLSITVNLGAAQRAPSRRTLFCGAAADT